MSGETMLETARAAIRMARERGAGEVAAAATRTRDVSVTWRDGKLEKITEATARRLDVRLYVDGRYSIVSTSDLRPEGLARFLDNAIALTRTLAADPHRSLPDPALYRGQAAVDLQLADSKVDAVTAVDRRRLAQELEAAARTVKGSEAVISVTAIAGDASSENCRVHSNGFEGVQRATECSTSVEVAVRDGDGRRPEDWAEGSARFFGDLPDAASVGRLATERALRGIGARKAASAVLPVVLENRVAGSLLRHMSRALMGSQLQQKRSFLEGKLGQAIGSALLSVDDDPLVTRGFGSRLYDDEGIAAKRMPIFAGGVLRSYYIDTYYGKKLGVAPTTGGASNVVWKLGDRGLDALLADIKEGVLVTSLLGGNSNDTTGDFSLGIRGFMVRRGKIEEPIAEMNLSGNHLTAWKRLAAVGNDPYPYSSWRTPALVFDGLQVAGT